tara:strand:- start:2209 stop:2838 length:630 start_codon:yes stop_codon:yes gene_type:complete
MAEIKIEKKKPVWPWILGILVVLAVIFYFVYWDNDAQDDDNLRMADDTEDTHLQDRPVTDQTDVYNDQTDSLQANTALPAGLTSAISDTTKLGTDPQYTQDAILQLKNAIQAKAAIINVKLNENLFETGDGDDQPNRLNTAGINSTIKKEGNTIVSALEKMQQEKYPNLSSDIEELKDSVSQIGSDSSQESNAINSFFKQSVQVLQKMN